MDPAQIPTSKAGLIQFIKDRLRVPIPPDQHARLERLTDDLRDWWTEVCGEFEVFNETRYIHFDDEYVDFELNEGRVDEELRPAAWNISTWIDKARERFLDTTNILYTPIALDCMTKHTALPGTSVDRLVAMSAQNSVFLPTIKDEELNEVPVELYEQKLRDVLRSDGGRWAVAANQNIGYSMGLPTRFISIDIGRQPDVVHLYPISEVEITSKFSGSYIPLTWIL